MKRPENSLWKWLLGILAVLVLLAAAAYVVVFRFNTFSLVVQLEGEPDMLLEYGTDYQEPGAQAILYGTLFLKEGIPVPDAQIRIDSLLQPDQLGKYTLTYNAQLEWLTASAQRTVRVVDRESPVIVLTEPDGPLLAGTAYEEDGFVATDNYDGDITDRVIRHESYGKVSYTVLDSSGNPAYAEREIPYYDPIAPVIHLQDGDHISIPTGSFFVDPGFTAEDNVDGDMTQLVEVEGQVLWYVPGTYQLTYSVTDGFENNTTVTRTVEVVAQPRPETKTPTGKVIYLSFDDGPGPYTDALLDVLAKYKVKATFFVVDSGYNQQMKRIVQEGHSIGIHSVNHDYHEIYASPEAFFDDLHRMQDIIYNNTGVQTTLLRFPGGSSNTISCFNEGIMSTLTEAVQDAGFQYFDWNVDSDDAGRANKSKTVFDNVREGVSSHRVSVVLQHDIRDFSVDAVEDIILWCLENGYTFLPLTADSPGFHHGVRN